jgi:hypothetical protein
MRSLLIFLFYIVYIQPNYAQLWHLPDDKKNETIPFELINNMIIVSVTLNTETLSFILDNGVKETLLFGEVDSLRLKNTSTFVFQGFGVGQPIKGLMSRHNKLEIGNIVDTSHHLYVITDTAFNLSKNIGVHIHGILGSSFFRNNVLAIDFIKKKLTFSRNVEDLGIKVSKYKTYPISIENDRAYSFVSLKSRNQSYQKQKLLLDLGNSDPMMLFDREMQDYTINTPFIRDYLGYGFNGAVFGLKNRIDEMLLGDYTVHLPIVSYPDSLSYDANKLAKNRVGSIGNQILSRFYLIFDYPNNTIYLRTNKNFRKPYTIDMSGLEIVHEGFEFVKHRVTNFSRGAENGGTTINFSTEVNYLIELHANYVIDQVRPNSPAERAGVQVGDKLLRINGRKVGKMKLQDIKQKLQAGQDKSVRIEIERVEQKKTVEFRLEDPLAIANN